MTVTSASEFPSMADRLAGALNYMTGELAALRAKRAQRLALAALLELDASRLDDLGISYQDVATAFRSR